MSSIKYRMVKDRSVFNRQRLHINNYHGKQIENYSERRYNDSVKAEIQVHPRHELTDYLNALFLVSLFGKK